MFRNMQDQATEAKKAQQSRSEELEQKVKGDARDLAAKKELAFVAGLFLPNYVMHVHLRATVPL